MQARGLIRTLGVRGSALFVALSTHMVAARASPDDHVPFILNYAAPPGCPGADRFLAEVAARTSVSRPAEPNERATRLTVIVKEVPGGDRGTLRLASPDGAVSARHVSAADCEQVVSALALMTALAIDPNASTAPAPSVAKREPVAASPHGAKSAGEASPRPLGSVRFRWRFQVGMGLEGLGGVAPEPLLLVRPYAELGSTGASRFSSAFRLSAGFGRRVVRESSGGAEYTLLGGRIEGCPARWRASSAWQISPCLAVDAGRLEVVGVGITPAERVVPPWIAPGALVRLQWELVDVLVVEVSGEALFPLQRNRFFVNSDATLYRTPVVAGGATAALGVRFP